MFRPKKPSSALDGFDAPEVAKTPSRRKSISEVRRRPGRHCRKPRSKRTHSRTFWGCKLDLVGEPQLLPRRLHHQTTAGLSEHSPVHPFSRAAPISPV